MEPINQININSNVAKIAGPPIIPTIEKPILHSIESPVVRGLEVPIIDLPNVNIKYPTINIPPQTNSSPPVKSEKEKIPQIPQTPKQQEEILNERGLPDNKPKDIPKSIQQIIPQLQSQPQQVPTPITESPTNNNPTTFTVNGVDINLPDPSLVATAGAVAVVTTASTMVATQVLNVVKNAAEPVIREATKNKFKIKIKQVKPVLHYVMSEGGHVDIFEYSSEGTRLVAQTENVEQYIRDQVDTNAYYEMDNKIIIDDIMAEKFTKEGKERFKSLFAPPKKIAKKLSARLSF
jgi:hypothetical protein